MLGGGGNLGACEVGMLRALLEAGVRPDIVVGTSVGALNGAAIAAEPTLQTIERLEAVWRSLEEGSVFPDPLLVGAVKLVRRRASLHSNRALRRLIERTLPVRRSEDLAIPFECVAASIERAAEHWFGQGDLVEAILASAAAPGLLPAVEIDGEHYIDGGVVNSIPIGRAVELGAIELYVLHVGRLEHALSPPSNGPRHALTVRPRPISAARVSFGDTHGGSRGPGTAEARTKAAPRPLVVVPALRVVVLSPVPFLAAAVVDVRRPRRWASMRVVAVAIGHLAFRGARHRPPVVLWVASGCGLRLHSPEMRERHQRFARWRSVSSPPDSDRTRRWCCSRRRQLHRGSPPRRDPTALPAR